MTTNITTFRNNKPLNKSTLAASIAVEDYVNSSMKSQLPAAEFSVEENEMDNGGFGTVHRGKKTSDGSLIAVKFSRDGHSMYPQAEYAALKELAQLNHAHIVKVARHFSLEFSTMNSSLINSKTMNFLTMHFPSMNSGIYRLEV